MTTLQTENTKFLSSKDNFTRNLVSPNYSGKVSSQSQIKGNGINFPHFTNEFWTSRQRQGSSIHEISYRACFKSQLPKFFIEKLTLPGDMVYDPFLGRGTTCIEAALLGRRVVGNDVNPLSTILTRPRLEVPSLNEIEKRLNQIKFYSGKNAQIDLSMFFESKTISEIVSLQQYLADRKRKGTEDTIDRWIRMVATNRLTGHSIGFFSVYTLPPNQATSAFVQAKINSSRNQKPTYRNVKEIIFKKSKSLYRKLTENEILNLKESSTKAFFLTKDARRTKEIQPKSIQLTVTSPPFLDIVEYSKDNWLRCWFNGIDDSAIGKDITMAKTVNRWSEVMGTVFEELYRISKVGGYVAFEVGEVRKGTINLEEYVIPLGLNVGFKCLAVLVNQQKFTKTSNIWGVDNNRLGTNTNRIVIFQK